LITADTSWGRGVTPSAITEGIDSSSGRAFIRGTGAGGNRGWARN